MSQHCEEVKKFPLRALRLSKKISRLKFEDEIYLSNEQLCSSSLILICTPIMVRIYFLMCYYICLVFPFSFFQENTTQGDVREHKFGLI